MAGIQSSDSVQQEEVVPENRDVVHWLQHLGTCELKVTKDAAG